MLGKFLSAFGLLVATPATAQIVHDYENNDRTKRVELVKNGKTTLFLSFGERHATVDLTVAPPPKDWPKAMWVGPHELGENEIADRMVTEVTMRVNGCLIEQPWPGIAGFAMPDSAILQFVAGQWQLAIYGSEASEGYGVTYAFDNAKVLEREILWGPDYFERTIYTIKTDPDVSPRDCLSADHVIPSTR